MAAKKNMLVYVIGILMIIFGIIAIIVGALALFGSAALGLSSTFVTIGSLFALISGIVELVAGVMGVKNAANPAKAQTLVIFGIITIALAILGNVISVAGGAAFSPSSLVMGVILPILYLIGAFQLKKQA